MEIVASISWMIIILCACTLVISIGNINVPLLNEIIPMTDEQKFAKDCKDQTGLDLFDMSYIRDGGYEKHTFDGKIEEKCVQSSRHDKYGRVRTIESITYKYDEDGKVISSSSWNEQIPEYPLYMYKFENVYRSYKEHVNKLSCVNDQ